jgi:hypothetical protein
LKLGASTEVYGFTSKRILRRKVVELIAGRGVFVLLRVRRQSRFPSVLLQPLYVRTQIADSTGRAVRDRRLSLAKEFVNRGAGMAMEISGRAPVTAWWL